MLNYPKIFLGHSVVKLVKPKLSCQEVQQRQLRTYCYLQTLRVDPLLNGPGNLMTEDMKRMRNMMSAMLCCNLYRLLFSQPLIVGNNTGPCITCVNMKHGRLKANSTRRSMEPDWSSEAAEGASKSRWDTLLQSLNTLHVWELSEEHRQADVTPVFRKGRSGPLQIDQFNQGRREQAIDCR